MESQLTFSPQDPKNQNSIPSQPGTVGSSSNQIIPEQSFESLLQAQADNSAPQDFSSGSPSTTPANEPSNSLKGGGFVKATMTALVITFGLSVGGYLLRSYGHHKTPNLAQGAKNSSAVAPAATNSVPNTPAGATIPYGSSATVKDFSLKISSVITNPQTTGDAPDAGMQYIEVDIAQANNGAYKDAISGWLTYLSAGNKEYIGANTFGTPPNPNKDVKIVGKDLLISDFLDPKKSDSKALIFQVPKGDKGDGKLIWHAELYEITSPRLAVFDLK